MLPNAAVGMAVQGPLARGAEDLELALDVIAGPGIGEDVAWRLALPAARHATLAEYRVAVLPAIPWAPVEPDILAALDELVGRLTRAGVRVQVAQPEKFGDLREYYKTYLSIMFAISAAGQPEERRTRDAAELRASGDEFLAAAARGNEASASDYIAWFGAREAYRAAYRTFFGEWDVLLAPANIVNAFPHGAEGFQDASGQPIIYMLQAVYPSLCNLSGQPGTAFPVGQTPSGLPIGLQAIGPYLEDRTPVRFAALVAREFGGFRRPAGYDEV
jgi:amidase